MRGVRLKRMTNRQFEVLQYIRGRMSATDRAPTLAEITRHFGWLSGNAAQDMVRALVRMGALMTSGRKRGITLAAP